MTSTDTYQLKWHSHSSHLNGSVAALLRSERFTDVVLCTLDGSQIPAHKFILSSCSVYLCNLFEGQRSVTRMGGMLYVVLPSEISTKALKILVEYMYKGPLHTELLEEYQTAFVSSHRQDIQIDYWTEI
uniref:BTB domain-containing protein n=1 Tax=Heliothis virescens TaxID=7102 RepID=A0A2A4J2K1_HELVI